MTGQITTKTNNAESISISAPQSMSTMKIQADKVFFLQIDNKYLIRFTVKKTQVDLPKKDKQIE